MGPCLMLRAGAERLRWWGRKETGAGAAPGVGGQGASPVPEGRAPTPACVRPVPSSALEHP